ncbi:CarboxypepD_reg-like domain-containing protein [Pseudarcicella hirudinis]|uniref:CarboxypepD_reg-like domain-containing protein n=1 Tax=Pseudarcicella hirudinis TaxID=1079859 RepID=A0A1I5YRK4_9BACT|nr:DUF5686 and carboxypeptidase regulatory-like domain-containing protein [Pseudarcicella hirudinis]SFQ46888.1 CarboxypepD_reg-like domain-containing protein [Pseudarcicella hirudinis]
MYLKQLLTKSVLLILCLSASASLFAGGIKGTVKNMKGEALSFASVLVKGTSKGTMANEDGKYELTLDPGSYEVIFQYLSHKTLIQKVEVSRDFVVLDARLEDQSVSLNEVKVQAGKEDPAYTIMRKAISMARFHQLEIDSYTARTYVKGTFQVKEVSGMLKMLVGKKIEKEFGVKIGTTYVLESINDITFSQPNTVKEKVISSRNNLPGQLRNKANPNITVARGNFYSPKVFGNLISPLSPSAFAYYKFSYLGSFEDRGQTVNKIQVTPKSKGDDVLSGIIYIIEDTWAIHSLNFQFIDENAEYSLKQIAAPFNEIWMPVSFDFTINFDAFGMQLDSRYIYNIRNYNLKVNPKYHQQPLVIDEKIDKAEAKAVKDHKINAKTALAQKEVTRKQLKKLLKDMEKEDTKEQKEAKKEIIARDYSLEVDTLARERNESFWNNERQVPLTETEVKGYAQADSLNVAEAAKIKKDSLKNLPKFKFGQLLGGHTYNYGKRNELYGYPSHLTYNGPLESVPILDFYNSVEGYYLNAGLSYQKRNALETISNYGAKFRYSFSRKRLNGIINWDYSFNKIHNRLSLSAGRFVQQFNDQNPISPGINAIYSLFFEENYLKLYEKSFVKTEYLKWFSEKFTVSGTFEYNLNSHVENNHFTPWIDNKDKQYTSNDPVNNEIGQVAFQNHNSAVLSVNLQFRPFAEEGRFNGRSYTINRNRPTFSLKSVNGLGETNAFNQWQLGYDQVLELRKLGDLHFNAKVGGFFKAPNYLMDFKHFNGNQTILSSGDNNTFRLLDYYAFSTRGTYAEVHADNTFRKLLLSQIPVLKLYGIKESLFANYLYTENLKVQYLEIGYGVSGIGKIAGIEVIGSFLDGKYQKTGLRVKVPF